jgi:uncharacterized protein
MSGSPELDRIAPTVRPDGAIAGTQWWRNLLFLHWHVPREEVRAIVPDELELDLWEDRTYVGLVPFRMHRIRPKWWPVAWGLNFLECNLRTYVHYRGRPGVYFFSLDASNWLACQGARVGWSLPYFHAKMSEEMPDGAIDFRVDRNPSTGLTLRYRIGAPMGPSEPGTVEHFLLERYLLFTKRRGKILCGHVHHVSYPTYHAEVLDLEESLFEAAGLTAPARPPEFVHWSPGVDVDVFPLRS